MAPKKEVEKKTLYDHIVKYQWILGIGMILALREADKSTQVTDRINKLEITIAEFKISLNNVTEEMHRN